MVVVVAFGCAAESGPDPAPPMGEFALQFDGTDDYATTGSASFPFPRAPHAISVWVRPAAPSGKQAVFVLRKDGDSGTELGLLDGVPMAWRIFDGGVYVSGTEPLEAERWQHLTYSFDGNEHSLYVDAELAGTGTLTPNNRTPITGWIGTFDGRIDFYSGQLDELIVFGAALTVTQVSQNRADPLAPSDVPRVGYWRFDEAEGERAFDHSSHGNHATLGDGVTTHRPARVEGGPFSESRVDP